MTRSKRRLILKFNMISFFSAVSLLHYFLPSRKSISMFKKVFVSHAKAPRVDFSRRAGLAARRMEEKRKDATNLWFILYKVLICIYTYSISISLHTPCV
ncbi:hypothetical protein P301_H10701 [Saccharomyces cerevisiae P301]|uniref:Putative uncharacterized protein YHR049C-A n=1 Tax=Saccharomyces cerevisiae (strain ATCC 204508 / S288c) TaxID=559292 RepID=YH049_YEAST|nr:RecName: Full=Putative uncharacterized protein YHR049C-A [Saccharomyces cerevisiae S288C]EWG85694.1 hypothetical protein R008_H11831 [Saccharomyces cerevisiae R008]EWG90633.1 hypothetical protein P301_H10701 [Saccharomyces cerevisiae P301]